MFVLFSCAEWVAERPLTKSVRHLTVKAIWDDSDDEDGYYRSSDNHKDERPRLVFLPGMGSHVLYHKGYKINVSRERPEHASGANSEQSQLLASIQKKQSLTISTWGRDMRFLKTILMDAMNEAYKKKEGKTTIYTSQPYDTYWSSSSTRAPRAFHSVILAKGLKEELLHGMWAILVLYKLTNLNQPIRNKGAKRGNVRGEINYPCLIY